MFTDSFSKTIYMLLSLKGDVLEGKTILEMTEECTKISYVGHNRLLFSRIS